MAVVSISRIQVRRGRAQSGTGLPQLASGELGWAIDTQELYIGNGAVSEGAPAVGNTKLLTEHDDLFQGVESYRYRDGSNSLSVARTLQSRLDDNVSARAFGITNSITIDQSDLIQNVIFELFPPGDTIITDRVTLNFGPGTYIINSTIYLPSYVTIVGAGPGKTIFVKETEGSAFRTVSSLYPDNDLATADAGTTTINQPRGIRLSGFSLELNVSDSTNTSDEEAIGLDVFSCKDSVFSDIEINGTWAYLRGDSTPDSTKQNSAGIRMTALSQTVTSKNNVFERITVKNAGYAVYSDDEIRDNIWSNCYFETLGRGIGFGIGTAGSLGPTNNIVEQTVFRDVKEQGYYVAVGTNNVSVNNQYYSVGNSGGSIIEQETSIIEFVDSSNVSINDWFSRSEDQIYTGNHDYLPEVQGPSFYNSAYTQTIELTESAGPTEAIKLPGTNIGSIELEYFYKSDRLISKGVLSILVDETNQDVTYSNDSEINELAAFDSTGIDDNDFALSVEYLVDNILVSVLNVRDANLYFKINTIG